MFFRCLVVFCLLSVIAAAQSSGQPDATSIQGIKIFSSRFDPTTKTATLDFMNDSASDITAWTYCMNVVNLPGDNVGHGGCRIVDTIPVVIDRDVQEKMTLKPINGDCDNCHVLHPGEHKILSADFSSVPVISAEIVVRLVVYANGRIETTGNDHIGLDHIAKQRQDALKQHQELAEMGSEILEDKSDQHPTATMIEAFKNKVAIHPEWAHIFHVFKSPEWRKGKDTEFIPKDERSYLRNYVTEQKMQAAEFSKHQILGVN